MLKLFGTIFSLTVLNLLSFGQELIISGKILNKSGKPIQFVNIGINKKNIGTISNEEGSFIFRFDSIFHADTITFSCVGYQTSKYPVKTILTKGIEQFQLSNKVTELEEVKIFGQKRKIVKLGTTSHFPGVSGCAKGAKNIDILEIVQLIKVRASLTRLISVNVFLTVAPNDTGIIRINFYKSENGEPTELIVEKSILHKKLLVKGWQSFDVSGHNIFMSNNFFIGFEFIPLHKTYKTTSICYGGQFGGNGLYERNASQGKWTKVPGVELSAFVTAPTD